MTTVDDETLRAMLAARTPGEWAPYCDEGPIRYRYLAPDGDGWTYSVCVGGHRDDDHTCVLTATGPDVATARANASMAAAAPALAAEVLRLRAERDDLHAAARVRVYVTDDVARIAEYASVDLLTLRAAARAHLAADDALSVARRTDAADVPTAEARAPAARTALAELVGYAGIGGGR